MSSRASSRSGSSPSASRGSSTINLGKDSGVNIGAKSQTSVSSGGIGITQEIGVIGGVGIAGGVSVELSPIGINISGDPNYEDPSKSAISISGSAEVPGGIIGIGGGVTINTSTGAIEGGSIGGEIIGIGVGISKSSGGIGIEISLQIPGTPIEISLGFSFPEDRGKPPSPPSPPSPNIGFPVEAIIPLIQNNKCYHTVFLWHSWFSQQFTWSPDPNVFVRASLPADIHGQGVWTNNQSAFYATLIEQLPYGRTPAYIEFHTPPIASAGTDTWNFPQEFTKYKANFKAWALINNSHQILTPGGFKYSQNFLLPWHRVESGASLKDYITNWRPAGQIWDISVYEIPCSRFGIPSSDLPKRIAPPGNSSPQYPPFPNPPPRKRNMDECCRESVKLLRELRIYHRESLRLLGRPLSRNGLGPITAKGFFPEETERIKTPINPKNPNERIKIKFTDYYQLANYFLDQLIKEDVANDPRSFKRPTGLLQNPNYNRDSGSSLTDNKQPEKDKSGNQRELELDKEIYIQSALQQQQYIFEALRRLEYLFPTGELNDAKIAKNLLIPGAKGDIKIHNMIQFQELFVQYINATLGDPRQILTIKDANPALAGDQPIEVSALTLADWARQITKFQIDTAGDVDAAVNLMLRDFRTNMANRTDIVKIGEIAQALFEDTGMREQQEYISLHLEGDPYAGQWIKGKGFKSNADLEKKTEEATEKVLQATLNPTNIKVKVSRRHKEEKTDMRDLLRGLADFTQRLLSIPTGGDAVESINKLIESAKFKIQTDAALLRQNISKAATASRNRTRKRKK